MSNWSHIEGIFRIHSLRLEDGTSEIDDIRKLFGTEHHPYDEDVDEWSLQPSPNRLPYGSEGSLYVHVWDNPNKTHVCAYTVSVFGDLRDHDGYHDRDGEEILAWMKYICEHASIRQAIVEVKNEWNKDTAILRCVGPDNEIKVDIYDTY